MKKLGWSPLADANETYFVQDFNSSERREVNYTTDVFGFRNFGDTTSERFRILFVGDSYTQAVEVSSDETFYAQIGDSLDVEIFAYGMAGYGNFQEYLVVDIYKDIVQPDLIMLQTCDNDFIDNCLDLEYYSNYKVGLRRPYVQNNGEITFRTPVPRWREVASKSKFIELLLKKLYNSVLKYEGPSSEQRMYEDHLNWQPYVDCLGTTERIMSLIKSSAGETPIVAFSSSYFDPLFSDMGKCCEKAGIPYWKSPILALKELKFAGETVNSADGYHWNQYGHRVMAYELISELLASFPDIKRR